MREELDKVNLEQEELDKHKKKKLDEYKWNIDKTIECISTFNNCHSPVTCFEEIHTNPETKNDKEHHLIVVGYGNPEPEIAIFDVETFKLCVKWKAHN